MKLLHVLGLLSTASLAVSAVIEEREADGATIAARAATVCGSAYEFQSAIPLPEGTDPNLRLGTLFSYIGNGKGCLILDNNVGASRYMYLSLCEWDGSNCDKDSGTFSQYAGPVYLENFACAKVKAKMGKSSSSLFIDYESEYVFPCN